VRWVAISAATRRSTRGSRLPARSDRHRSAQSRYLKRPASFPVLDEIVVQTMGVNVPNSPTLKQRIAIAQRVSLAIRRETRRNLKCTAPDPSPARR
jgi:hypothetical protein